MFTRKEYLDHPCHLVGADPDIRMDIHRLYYAQFVNSSTISSVVKSIGGDRLLASTDRHFNDIPEREWVKATYFLSHSNIWKEVGDYPTESSLVCIAKEAARQWVEAKTS